MTYFPPLREELLGLKPYGAPQLDVPVQLNVNENPYGPSPAVVADVATAVADCVRAAQLNCDIDPDADPDDLAFLLLTVIRGSDVVGAYGHSPDRLTSIAESAFALLPRPRHH